jgi:crossover junction endodeoxyribonuclease RusA
MSRLSFELPFPPSVNTYYRNLGNNRVLISKKGRAYKKLVKSILSDSQAIKGDIHIAVLLCPPDKRKRDLDNFDGKALWDALTGAGVWLDDSQVKSRYSAWGELCEGGKIYVEINKIGRG